MTEKQVTDYLSRAKAKYKDLAKRDILSTLKTYKELAPGVERYVFSYGECQELFHLNGTIPVIYKNNRYNIPVQIYLPETFPYVAPICYVRPTNDMSINVSDTVDANGKISLPYLGEWKHPKSDLSSLISIIALKFGEVTPLFSKSSRSISSAATTQYPNSSVSTATRNNNTPYPSTGATQPYPSMNSGQQYPSVSTTTPYPPATSTQPYPPTAGAYGGGAPYPTNNYYNNYVPYPTYGGYMPAPSLNPQSQQGPTPPPKPPAPVLPSSQTPVYPYPYNNNSNYNDMKTTINDDTIKPEHLKMSLVSAVKDKVDDILFGKLQLKSAESDELKNMRHKLELGSRTLEFNISELQKEIESVQAYTQKVRQASQKMQDSMGLIKSREKSDVEDAVIATAPLYRQIMNLFSEELAIQDLIFYLNEGLMSQTISLEVFLKQIRLLSRKQFMVRALILQCRTQAGLRS